MSDHYLNKLFEPESIALFGASNREGSVGKVLLENLLDSEYEGAVVPINLKYQKIRGRKCYASLDEVKGKVDLAVIATPAETVPSIVEQCGLRGIRAAVVISAGFREIGEAGRELEEQVLRIARKHQLRLLGPNCLGLMRPPMGLNATFFRGDASPGGIALVSQSGAVCTSILDWARLHGIGFSTVVSMGASADIDFGEVLDYVALDEETRSILLYIEGLNDARSFMSGVRAASRFKPVIALKVGRYDAGSRAVLSHTGALVGSDDAYEAAFRRAGVVRVDTIAQLFAAAEVLSGRRLAAGNRLAVVTNGGGPGVLAADTATRLRVPLAAISDATRTALGAHMPPHGSIHNPIDILGDASPARYEGVLGACLDDPGVDGALVILAPQAMTSPLDAAQLVINASKTSEKPVIAVWMGGVQVQKARQALIEARIPCFDDPVAAVEAYSFLVAYRNNQRLLLQTPAALVDYSPSDKDGAQMIIAHALEEGRRVLTQIESKAVLSAFRIPVNPSIHASTAHDALLAAEELGFPVVMKISSPDISHKSDVDGVAVNIKDAFTVRSTFADMIETVHRRMAHAKIEGVTIEKMVVKPHGRELMIGVVRDDTFGPLIEFGLGGKLVELLRDKATALPPLDEIIVTNLLEKTRAGRFLDAFRNLPEANIESLLRVLLRVSELVCELPAVLEMDLNPVLIDENDAIVVDARIVVDASLQTQQPYGHLAIHPYPAYLSRRWQLADGTPITIRPIRPEDAGIEKQFVDSLSPQSKYFRFMGAMHELSQEMLVRFTQIDYDREMALIAVTEAGDTSEEIAVGRYITSPDGRRCEFAIVVADAWQRKGIGYQIMSDLIRIAKMKGLEAMDGEILRANKGMLRLVDRLGFEVRATPEDSTIVKAVKDL